MWSTEYARVSSACRWLGLLAVAGACPALQAQEGHSVAADRVVVNRADHWAAWQGGARLVQPVDDGIRPLRQRKDINAALDATQFEVTGSGGVTTVTNTVAAPRLIDGDTLSWGPDPRSPLRDWWAEINLGRLVVVRRIIVRFAEPGYGDPFLQFKVLGWRHGPPTTTRMVYNLRGTDIPRFWEIGRTDRPNKTQRVFEFVPRPTQEANEAFVGDALSHIRIVAIASDSSAAEPVSRQAYDALPPAHQGRIDYYRRERSGEETRISAAAFQRIDAERRGSVRYHRREVPRIAEIEVITAGGNINLGLQDRQGLAQMETTQNDFKTVTLPISDGDYATAYVGPIFEHRAYEFNVDLGALLWVDTVHFITDGPQPIDGFTLDLSDGGRAPDGSILWRRAVDASVEGIREFSGGSAASLTASEGVRFRELHVPPAKIRYLRTMVRNPLRGTLSNIGINEVMLYGDGFVPEVVLTSDLVHLPRAKNLIDISWEAQTPPGTAVQLQTRSGNELAVDTLYFDTNGNPKTASQYRRLPSSKKGDVQYSSRPGGDWSPWSPPHTESGQQITSPSPRQFLQMRATLRTDSPGQAATLRSIELGLSDPVAESLTGEIFPVRVPAAAQATVFHYYVRPSFSSTQRGFDELLITTPGGARLDAVEAVLFGSDDALAAGTATQLVPPDVQVVVVGNDSLQLRLPRRIGNGTDLVEVRLQATIFGNVGSFQGFVRGPASRAWQRVDTGDASSSVPSSTTTVLVQGSELISGLQLNTPVISPNGDGVNDEMVFDFSVTRLSGSTPVRLRIYDLSGTLRHEETERRMDARGGYLMRWDGTGMLGKRVAPGIYLARIEIDVDTGASGQVTRQRVIQVVY